MENDRITLKNTKGGIVVKRTRKLFLATAMLVSLGFASCGGGGGSVESSNSLDISNPSLLEEQNNSSVLNENENYDLVAQIPLSAMTAMDVYVSGNYAYVVGVSVLGTSGARIIDIGDLSNPQVVAQIGNIDASWQGVVQNGYWYIAGCGIVDVSDPFNPQVVNATDCKGYRTGIFVSNNYLYVADSGVTGESGNLLIEDITNPAYPETLGSVFTEKAWGVFVNGDFNIFGKKVSFEFFHYF
jgi:hypothetical protein